MDNVFCLFQGHVENIASLKQLYGLGKTTNEAIIVIEAYKTLRDRGPFPASQVVRDLRGHFAFVLFDISSNSTFIAAVSITVLAVFSIPLSAFILSFKYWWHWITMNKEHLRSQHEVKRSWNGHYCHSYMPTLHKHIRSCAPHPLNLCA